MFRRLSKESPTIRFFFDGYQIDAVPGDSVATALLAAGHLASRTTASGKRRGPHCMMGSCFECLVEIDGQTRQQACLVLVEPGLKVLSAGGGHDE